MICANPACHHEVPAKDPALPGPQAIYCSRRCNTAVQHARNVERRRRDRIDAARARRTVLDRLSDDALARLSHRDLAALGVDLSTQQGAQQ